MSKISILICTLQIRRDLFRELFDNLCDQARAYGRDVEILVEADNGERTIGDKRNELLSRATGDYLCFVDDDDEVPNDYLELLIKAANSGADCASLKGTYYIDGKYDGIFEHSLKYSEWKTNPPGSEVKYERYPNHLNLIRSSIAKQFKYPEKNFGEDFDWSKKIHESGLLKTEYYIPEILYYYKFITNK